jgi:hypothetical protein
MFLHSHIWRHLLLSGMPSCTVSPYDCGRYIRRHHAALVSILHYRHSGPVEAIDTLERGRGLLWSELRGLRTATDLLRYRKVN